MTFADSPKPGSQQPLSTAPAGMVIPLRFEPCSPINCGDSPEWKYIGIKGSNSVLIAPGKIAFLRPDPVSHRALITTLEIAGAAANSTIVPGKRMGSEANYFRGSDPKQWRSHVPDYDSVTLQGVYPGIDLRFYQGNDKLEFDLLAQPGADLNKLQFRVQNDTAQILKNGDLLLGSGSASLTIHIPSAYQIDSSNQKLPVAARFSSTSSGEITLVADNLRKGLPTVIDPTIAFSTLLAQSSEFDVYPDDVILTNVAVDGSGNTWVAGTSYGPMPDLSMNPQLECSAYCREYNYVGAAFAAKFDSSGNLLVSDMLGNTVDNNVGMTLDSQGNVYLDGDTEDGLSFPTTAGAFDTGATSYQLYKMFVSKIDSTGSNLVFSTLLGSTSGQTGATEVYTFAQAGNGAWQSLAVDSEGDVYVTGVTQAGDFPVTANAIKSSCGSSTCSSLYGILTEFNPTGSALVYSTLVGGAGGYNTYATQLAIASGKVILSGLTTDRSFPVSPTAIHRTMGSCDLAGYGQSNYLASIDPTKSGSAGLVFSTFICEEIQSMALDSHNDIYLGVIAPAGTNNTPPTPGSFVTLQPNTACQLGCTIPVLYPGIGVEEISADGAQVLKMSYIDVSQHSALDSIAVDGSDNVYVSGHIWMDSAGAPIVDGVQSYLGTASECNNGTWALAGDTKPACSGLFVMKLDPQLDAPLFATIYGPQNGSVNDSLGTVPSWLALDSSGNIYVAGWEELISWPTGTFQNGGIGTQEGYLLKITDIPANPGVLLTSDHLFYPSPMTCLNDPYTNIISCVTPNNYNQPSAQTVTVVNHSGTSIQIESITATGTANPLSASQNCVGTVEDGAACSVTVSFTPQSLGDLTGTVTITDSSSTSPHIITGIGTGYMGQGSPASGGMSLPSTAIGKSSVAQTLLFNNTGNLSLNVSGIAVTGDFSETNNCSGGINTGTGCAIYVTFTPTQSGTRTGTLSIADDGPGSPHIVTLTGTGTGGSPTVILAPTSLSFSSQTTGSTSAAQTVTLTNSGTAALSITSIAVSGDFARTTSCNGSLTSGTNCTVSVTFTPTAVGTRTGTLTITDNATGSPQTVALSGTGVASGPPALRFVAVTPCRIADTRGATGPFGGPELSAGSTRVFDVPQSACGIPATAVAYSLNVTVLPNASLNYLTLWPTGQAQPNVSTLNSDGRIKANAAIVPAGTNGSVSVYVSNATQVILDIDGYFVPAGTASALAFYPLTPCRVGDTRNSPGSLGGPSLTAGSSRAFPVQSSACNIPATARAYSLNITTLPHKTLNYLTTWPTGETQPTVSTLNAPTGAITANAAIVPAGTSGDISIFVSDAADVILDVNGYFAPPAAGGLSLYAVIPCRVIDTRPTAFNGVLGVDVETSSCAPPSIAQAYVVNATVVPPGTLDYLTLWPAEETQPVVSTLNSLDGAIASNMAIVPTTNGSIDAFAYNPTNLILDISSYFAP